MMGTGRLAFLMILPLAAVLAGCAHGSAVPGSSPSSARPSAAPAACTGDPGTTRLVLTDADNGARRCLAPAGVVEVYLHGTATDRWSPLQLTGTGLRVAPSGKGALAVGVTAGFYAGTGPGEAQLQAFRSPCTAADPASSGCDGAHLVRITIVLR